jgi:hypothetical protein
MYVLKFYKNNQPLYVAVDELVPCQVGNYQPQFARAPSSRVQWVSLVEKAYAKLHHAYSALTSGDIAQGLSDLTNSLPVKQQIDSTTEDLYKKLSLYQKTKQLMGCSITCKEEGKTEKPVELNGEKCGLVYGHAYSVTDVM